MNNKGQFSIIAALLVAIVLIASVVTTYSAIRYNTIESQPQILSAIDETNLALKQLLGFSVGYYGSVLQVTGNSTYAYSLAAKYLDSGLQNVADIRPEWGASFNVTSLSLGTNWFTNGSYSQGTLNVTYGLTGLGISGIAYSASCRLDAQISPSTSNNQIYLTVTKDENEPVVGLSTQNFKFYLYRNSNSTWGMVNPPDEPVSSSNGTYIIDVPSGINSKSCAIQVTDTRGINVAACSFSHFTAGITFNSTIVSGGDYVDKYNSKVDAAADFGSHSNFTAQQQAPDSIFDTVTQAFDGTVSQPSYPSIWNPVSLTSCVGGTISDLQSNNQGYMNLSSYGSSFSGSATLGYNSVGTLTQSIENTIRGSSFTIQGYGQAHSITLYLELSGGATNKKVKAAIYSDTGNFIAGTEEKTVSSNGWYTFNLNDPKPILVTSTNYLLVAWSTSGTGDIRLRYDAGSTNQGQRTSLTYGNWPSSSTFNHDNYKYSIYCTYTPANLYTVQAEFTGHSTSPTPWSDLIWTMDSSASTSGVAATFQLYKWGSGGGYPNTDGSDGYKAATLGISDSLTTQTIADGSSFLNSTGYWKLEVTATKSTPFNLNLDMINYSPDVPNYRLNMQEQWIDLNSTYLNPHTVLCINMGSLAPSGLALDVWSGGAWHLLSGSLVSGWNNISISSYLSSSIFTIRLRASNLANLLSWRMDTALLRPESDQELFLTLNNPAATVAVELLQNGTMRWIGQNLQFTSQTIPVPPVPVKSIHVNETIDGVNQQVPFQIEDWASGYTVPLGLSSNTTIFGNRQMIVFLVNTHVSDFTLWWDGSDQAVQTSLAFTNKYFTADNPSGQTLSNGHLTLHVTDTGKFTLASTVGSSTSTTTFMNINNNASNYGAGAAYIIHHGVVRDIIQQEAEWNGGASGCPNLYANIVLTLPANATYFTYQLTLMFMDSTQPRTINSLCPISLSSTSGGLQTENGTVNSDPIFAADSQVFNASDTAIHHWSQFTDGINGAGIMFTDQGNQMLYTFDNMTATHAVRGALKADSSAQAISLLPVTLNSVTFQNALDVTWQGAVATFDGSSTPIYAGYNQPGLWILAELPPTIDVTVGN
jgi:hypothetical protein